MKPWVLPAVLTAACLGGVLERVASPPQPQRAQARSPAPPEAFALLDGLSTGDRLAGWTVLGVTGPVDRVLTIDVARDETRFSVSVAARGAVAFSSPRQTERYDLYYGHPHPRNVQIPRNAVRAIMAGVERRVRRNEASVQVPGL